jgi:hypothetical protein
MKKMDQLKRFLLVPLIVATPQLAFAFSANDIFGLFNIFVGLMIVSAFFTYIAGLIVYGVRMGTEQRVQGIRIMEWGVVILFVLIVLLALVHYFQAHPNVLSFLISAVIIIIIIYAVVMIVSEEPKKKEEE